MTDTPVDFSALLLALRREFGSVSRIAREFGYGNPAMLNRLLRGETTEPPFTVGVCLCGLYAERVGGPVPRIASQACTVAPYATQTGEGIA